MKAECAGPGGKYHFNLFDLFLVLLVLLVGLSVYFTFINPVQFSHLIKREDVKRYAEVEIILPDDLSWIKESVPAGEESRNVFGELDWKVLGFGEQSFGGKNWAVLKAKMLVAEKDSGVIRYGKYTLAKGSKIYLINDRYALEGRVLQYRLLPEKVFS